MRWGWIARGWHKHGDAAVRGGTPQCGEGAAHRQRMRLEAILLDRVQHRQPGRRADRVAAEGVEVFQPVVC